MNKPMKVKPRRFIAGAVCPSCEQMDTLVLIEHEETKIFQCIACHYEENLAQNKVPDEEFVGTTKNKRKAPEKKIAHEKRDDIIQWFSIDGD